MSNEQTSDKWLRPFSFSWKGPYHDRLEWVDAAGKKLSLDAILALLNAAPRPSLAAQEICRSYKIGEFNDLICCLDKGHSGEHNYVVKKPPFPTPARRECEHGNAYNECNRCNTSFQPTPASGETPRTDALLHERRMAERQSDVWDVEDVEAFLKHARQLERELHEAGDGDTWRAAYYRTERKLRKLWMAMPDYKQCCELREKAEREAAINMENFKVTNQAYIKMDERRMELERELAAAQSAKAAWSECAKQKPPEFVAGMHYLCWFQDREAILEYDPQAGWLWGDGSYMNHQEQVTHWMELPPVPSASTDESSKT